MKVQRQKLESSLEQANLTIERLTQKLKDSQSDRQRTPDDAPDSSTQLVKSLALMIGTLQSDMELKRSSDQEVIKLLLQTKQQDSLKKEVLEKQLQEKLVLFDSKMNELANHVNFKIEDHEDQIQLLNQAYVTTHNQFQHAQDTMHHTSRTLAQQIEGIKEQQSIAVDMTELRSQRDRETDIKPKLRQIMAKMDQMEEEQEKLLKWQKKIQDVVEKDLQPEIKDVRSQVAGLEKAHQLQGQLIRKCLDGLENSCQDMTQTSDKAWAKPRLDLETMSSTFNVRIDDAIGPIRQAVKELQEMTVQQKLEMMQMIQEAS